MVDDGEATWRPPPRIGMVKKFPRRNAVLIGPRALRECSRRRYLAPERRVEDGVRGDAHEREDAVS